MRAKFDSLAARAEHKLKRDTSASLAWESVPLSLYQNSLPHVIRSSWVFAVRAGANTGAESHPNSHQRMMSFRGSGDLQIWDGTKWNSNHLWSDIKERIESRWVSIPPDILHRAVALENNWVVVSFHTARSEELIEERPDPQDPRSKKQRLYI